MDKYYFLAFDKAVDRKLTRQSLLPGFPTDVELIWLNDFICYFICDANIDQSINDLLPLWENDLATRIAALVCHRDDELAQSALQLAGKYQSGKLSNLFDIALLAVRKQETAFLQLCERCFTAVSPELLRTMQAFLLSNDSAKQASYNIYIHRNTWLYRLNKFIDQTGLDLRDSDNAAFFRFWLSWQKIK